MQTLYSDKLDSGLKSSYVRIMHKLLHKALKNAVKWKLVSFNVCDAVKRPREEKHKAQTLTIEQAKALIAAARSRGHQLGVLVILASTTGMRHGELAALRWQDIDFEQKRMRIRRTVSYVSSVKDPVTGEYKIKGGYIEGEPKTAKSKREIMLPNFVVTILKLHQVRQKEARSWVGEAWENRDLVFCNRRGGFLYPDWLLAMFRKLLDEVGLPSMRLHDLRHTLATILSLEIKEPEKLVQELWDIARSTSRERFILTPTQLCNGR